jgi:hypothetical protein
MPGLRDDPGTGTESDRALFPSRDCRRSHVRVRSTLGGHFDWRSPRSHLGGTSWAGVQNFACQALTPLEPVRNALEPLSRPAQCAESADKNPAAMIELRVTALRLCWLVGIRLEGPNA